MAEAENKPSIRIHIDQQVTIDAVNGREEVEDATVATEITGFDVEGDSYIHKGALSLTGFLRQADESGELPDEFDDQDVFATEAAAEAQLIPLHQRMPFVLQVPVAAQVQHQREQGILNVNPRIGQWNLHVLGEKTVHLRCELILQGLSSTEGYVFRCGTQEEGVAATRLDQLLEDEVQTFIRPVAQIEEEFVPPFETAWRIEEESIENEAVNAAEDDWVIETPAFVREEQEPAFYEEEEETEVVFTPDPALHFPLPDPSSEWVQQLQATDRMFNDISTPSNPFTPEIYGQPQARQPFEHQQFEEAAVPTPWRAEETIAEPIAEPTAQFDPYAGIREQFQTEDVNIYEAGNVEERAFLPNQPVEFEVNAPIVDEFVNEWQQPTVGDFTTGWQQPSIEREPAYEEPQYEEDDDEDAFIVERAEPAITPVQAFEEPQTPLAPPVQQTYATPVAEATEPVAEFTFEDEVPRPEAAETVNVEPIPAVASPSEAVPTLGGPKISFSGKPREEVEQPVKLSAIFGNSEAPVRETAEVLTRESSSSSHHHHHHHHESHSHEEYGVVVVKPLTKDSIWGGMLAATKESKVTMKFHIVQVEESLPGLAERYNTSISDLLRANNLASQEVDLGQILYIPVVRR